LVLRIQKVVLKVLKAMVSESPWDWPFLADFFINFSATFGNLSIWLQVAFKKSLMNASVILRKSAENRKGLHKTSLKKNTFKFLSNYKVENVDIIRIPTESIELSQPKNIILYPVRLFL
jgi:hypothetical protein